MIYERYRGSDTTNTVPRRLAGLRSHERAIPAKEKIGVFRQLLEIEKEPNWRGYLLWRIGRTYLDEKRQKDAMEVLLDARDAFDPLLGTIRDVMGEYCSTLYYLILGHYADREEIDTIANLAQVVAVNLEGTDASNFEKAYVFSELGYALNALAKKYSLDTLRSLAVACYLRWHHLQPEEPSALEALAYSYFAAADMSHCRSAVEMCLEVAPAGGVRDRIQEFAREHSHELDPAREAS